MAGTTAEESFARPPLSSAAVISSAILTRVSAQFRGGGPSGVRYPLESMEQEGAADRESAETVPIDPAIRAVLEEFSREPLALASEVVRLRLELGAALWEADRANVQRIAPPPPVPPPDAAPPVRL